MSEPIVQRITVDAEQALAALKQVAQGEQQLADDVKKAGDAAATASKSIRERDTAISGTRSRLQELVREEMLWETSIALGHRATEADTRAVTVRRAEIDRLKESMRQTTAAQGAATESIRGTVTANEDAGRSIGSMIARYTSLASATALATRAIQANAQSMRENAEAANALKATQLDLQFMNQGLRFDELAAVKAAGELKGGGDALIDASKAFGELKSQTANLSDADRIKLFEQMTETSLTTTAPLSSLTGLFAKGSQFVQDPERLQQLIRKAQEISPVDRPELLAERLPRSLGVGNEVGLTAEQSTGLFVSALLVDKTKGETSLRNILTILAGDQTPEQQQILEAAGAPRSSGVMKQLAVLRDAKLDAAQKSALVGRENFTVFSGLLDQNQFEQNVASMFEATTSKRDLTKEAIDTIYAGDAQQRLRLQTAQATARVEAIKAGDVEAQKMALARALADEAMRKAGLTAFRREMNLRVGFDWLGSVGLDPASALENLPPGVDIPSLDRVDLDAGVIGRAYRATPAGGGGGRATTVIQHQTTNNIGAIYHAPVNPALLDTNRRDEP